MVEQKERKMINKLKEKKICSFGPYLSHFVWEIIKRRQVGLGIMSRLEETGKEYERKDQTHLFEAIGESQKVVSSLQTKLCFIIFTMGKRGWDVF